MIASQDSSFTKTKEKLQQVAAVVSQDPAVAALAMFIGSSSANQANLSITLKPKDTGRKATADQVITRLRPKLAQIVGAQTFLQAAQDINVGGRTGQAQYQYTLSDSDLTELNVWAPKLLAALKKVPQLTDVSSDQQSQGLAVNLAIDRDAAGRFGISPTNLDTAIYDLIGQDEVAQYYTTQNSYHVIVEAPPGMQATSDLFDTVYPALAPHRAERPALAFCEGRPPGDEQPDRQPPGRISRRHPLLQSRPRRCAEPGNASRPNRAR